MWLVAMKKHINVTENQKAFVCEKIVEAIWSKVDNFISKFSLWPQPRWGLQKTLTCVGGYVQFSCHAKSNNWIFEKEQKWSVFISYLEICVWCSFTLIIKILELHSMSQFLVDMFLSTPPQDFSLTPSLSTSFITKQVSSNYTRLLHVGWRIL